MIQFHFIYQSKYILQHVKNTLKIVQQNILFNFKRKKLTGIGFLKMVFFVLFIDKLFN